MLRLIAACAVWLASASAAWAQAQGPAAKPMPPVDAQPPSPSSPAPQASPEAGLPAQPAPPGPAAPGPPAVPPPALPPPAVPASGPAPLASPPGTVRPGPLSHQGSQPIGTGLTVEAGLGLGRLRVGDAGTQQATNVSLGVGLWITPSDALSLRISGGSHGRNDVVTITASVLSLGLQHWFTRSWWLGAGAGVGTLTYEYLDARADPDPQSGLGLELRAGYCFGIWGKHALSLGLDASHLQLEEGSATAVGVLLSYQYL